MHAGSGIGRGIVRLHARQTRHCCRRREPERPSTCPHFLRAAGEANKQVLASSRLRFAREMVDEWRALESGRIGVAASLEHRQRHRLLTTSASHTSDTHCQHRATAHNPDGFDHVGDRLCAVGRLVNVVHTKLQCTIGRGESQQSFMPLHTRSCTWNTDERWREGGTDAGGGGGEREISEDGNRVGIGDWVVHVDR